jgi:AcrR family transcriptional regulator
MPYPTQITREAVIDKARALIEAEGLDQVSLNRLAAALNVKAPSLYRYFDGKAALLRAVNEGTGRALVEAILASIEEAGVEDAPARLLVMARTYRAFAHANPLTYQLLFSAEFLPDAETSERMVLPLQAVVAEVSGETDSLAALRGVLALMHGYVSLELNGQFRRGGDLDAMYTRIVKAYLDGWT